MTLIENCLNNHPTTIKLTVYKGFIRPLMEFATLVWNAGLTKAQVNKFESIQK